MVFTPRLNEAIRLSSHLHRYQTRMDEVKTPYSSHLYAVALIVSSVTDDEDVIIAALMHDSLEDVPGYTYDMLVRDFGERVATIVKHVTEPLDANKEQYDQLPWLERKETYLRVLKEGPIESAIVSAADKIHNTVSFLSDVEREGEVFLSRFSSSISNRVWFHEQALRIIREKLGDTSPLVRKLEECTLRFSQVANR